MGLSAYQKKSALMASKSRLYNCSGVRVLEPLAKMMEVIFSEPGSLLLGTSLSGAPSKVVDTRSTKNTTLSQELQAPEREF